MKVDKGAPQKVKRPTRQKIVVEQGRVMFSPFVPYKVLHTEIVASREDAIERVKELKEEYRDVDSLCVQFFSL